MWIISFRLISFLKNQTDIIASASIEAVKVKQAETVIFEFVIHFSMDDVVFTWWTHKHTFVYVSKRHTYVVAAKHIAVNRTFQPWENQVSAARNSMVRLHLESYRCLPWQWLLNQADLVVQRNKMYGLRLECIERAARVREAIVWNWNSLSKLVAWGIL